MADSDPAANGWRSGTAVRRCEVKVLCKDPYFARNRNLKLVDLEITGEEYLGPGPTSRRVAVVDYNADLDVVFEPAAVRADGGGFVVGRLGTNYRENIKFRQVNVWAVINRTLSILEDSRLLGRPIPWASGQGRLLVLPHAGYGENAFYDRKTGAIHFLYFEGVSGEQVYTCLSHDIVTHELGHAVLDGLKPGYNELSSAETAAFHEFFGDALAITSSLTFRELLAEIVGKTRSVELDKVVGEIAAEFGSARGGDPFLRSAAVFHSMSELGGTQEEHSLSEVLTNTFYEFLKRRYRIKLREVLARDGKSEPNGGHAVRALVNATSEASQVFLRAIDYCPPVDVSFAQYARAIVAADTVAYPTKPAARNLVVELLSERGIVPEAFRPLENRHLSKGYDVERIAATFSDAAQFLDANRPALGIPMTANIRIQNVYRTKKSTASGYLPPQEVVIEFGWTEEVALQGSKYRKLDGTRATLHCGGTLVFDRTGNVLHYVLAGDTPERRRTLLAYIEYLVRRGRLGVREQGFGSESAAHHQVQATVDGNRVTFARDAALRHGATHLRRRYT